MKKMTLQEKTKIVQWGSSKAVKIPSNVYKDSAFPYTEKDTLHITIQGEQLIITRKQK